MQLEKMNKIVQDSKIEIETIKKTQIGNFGNVKFKNLINNYRGKLHENARDGRENFRQ